MSAFSIYFVPFKQIRPGVLRLSDEVAEVAYTDDFLAVRHLILELRKKHQEGVCFSIYRGNNEWSKSYWFIGAKPHAYKTQGVKAEAVPKAVRMLHLIGG